MLFTTKNLAKHYSNCNPNRARHRHHRNFRSPFSAAVSANIREDAEAFHIELLAAGRSKDEFKLNLSKNQLTVSYAQEKQDEGESAQFTHKEFGLSSFERSFILPSSVDKESIEATYENGILEIKLAKREEAKDQPARNISIK